MNVLILHLGTHQHELAPLLEVFEELSISVEVCSFTAELSSNIEHYTREFTNLLYFPEDRELCKDASVGYLCGYYQALNNSLAVYHRNGIEIEGYLHNSIIFYNEEEVLDYYRNAQDEWDKDIRIKNAIQQLNNQGISFSKESLFMNVAEGAIKAVELFTKAGMPLSQYNRKGVPLISVAVRKKHFSIVEFLLKKGVNVNDIAADRGNTPLMDACSDGNLKIAECLLEAGADLNVVNKNTQTALILAVGRKSDRIAVKLLELGADREIRDSLGMSAKQYAVLFGIAHIFDDKDEAAEGSVDKPIKDDTGIDHIGIKS